MNILRINKKTITSYEHDEKKDTWSYVNIDKMSFPFSRYFSQVVEIAEDVTIEDFMNHLKKHSELIDLCFYSYLSGESIVPFCELASKKADNKMNVDSVEMYWTNDLVDDEYFLYGTLHGIITNKKNFKFIEENRSNSFLLDLSPINDWKHCKLFINDTIKASTIDEEDQTHIMRLRNRWTFFELLQYFLYELTCYGSIEDQTEEREIFETNQVKYDTFRVDPDFAKKLDKEELIAFIDGVQVEIDMATESLEMAVKEEDFEMAKSIKDEIDELEIELVKMKNRLGVLKK